MDPRPAQSVVAVVGRPNVGKSTLVNRIVGRREAIVEERPGVTRDRKILDAEWVGRPFAVVDTGGWLRSDEPLARQVSLQAERAIDEADLVVLVVDGVVGPTDEDAQVAAILRRSDKPVLLAVNKVDDANREPDAWDFTRLGIGDPIPVSALHGRGSGELLDLIVERLPPEPEPVTDPTAVNGQGGAGDPLGPDGLGGPDKPFSVAIVGRPNVGKSTLFNRLVGEERAVVHDAPGTTRDTIDTVVETEDGWLRFVDTAGMRRKSRIDETTEYYSLVRALQAIDRSDAALLVIDATEGVTHQDQRLAERIDASGCAVVVVLNKWDVLSPDDRDDVLVDVADRLAFLSYAPVLKTSALTGQERRPAAAGAVPGPAGVSPPGADQGAQRGAAGRPAGPAAAGRAGPPPPRPLCHPGRHRPADLHAVHHPGAVGRLPALSGAQDPGGVLHRADADQAPGPPPGSPG